MMSSLAFWGRRNPRAKKVLTKQRRRQVLSRLGGFAAEALEPRNLMAAVTYVNDDWHFVFDVDESNSLTVGDIVSRGPGVNPSAAYGQTAFGAVGTGDHTGSLAGSSTISNALGNTNPGGTVNLLAGNYVEDLVVGSSVNLVGEGAASTTLNATGTGVLINGGAGSVTLSGFTVNGGATGLRLDAYNGALTLTDLALNGQSGDYITLSNSLVGGELNATDVTFSGVDGTSTNLAALYDIEDKITHALDTTAAGLVRVTAGEVYVTTNTLGINRGSNVASAGNTVNVEAGTYVEDVVVNKALTLLGANSGIDPNTGTRVAESIIRPATSNPDVNSGGAVVLVDANNVTIDGFSIDGDNLGIVSAVNLNGANIDAVDGIFADRDSGLSVLNNIIQNTTFSAVDLDNGNTGTAVSNNTVAHNLLRNLGGGGFSWGIGVFMGNNFYADVTDNVIRDARIGVQTGNFHLANPGTSGSISRNDIQVRRRGIFHNLAYQQAGAYSLENNTITAIPSLIGDAVIWDGIVLSSLQDTVDAVVSGNTVDGSGAVVPSTGYHVWNTPTTTEITVLGGSVTGVDLGVEVTNFDQFGAATGTNVTLDGITITARNTGVLVNDDPLNANAAPPNVVAKLQNLTVSTSTPLGVGVSISGNVASASLTGNDIFDNAVGVEVSNAATVTAFADNNFDGGASADNGTDLRLAASAGGFTAGGGNTFAGETFFVDNLSNTDIDLTSPGNDFEGLTNNFRIEDKIHHAVDTDLAVTNGLVTWVADNLYITTPGVGSTDSNIQRGVDAASSGDTVNVEAGDYIDQTVNINKQITLSGANAGLSAKTQANRDLRGTESQLVASAPGAAMGIQISSGGAGTIIDGIAFKGAGLAFGSWSHVSVLAENVIVRNIISNSDLDTPFQVAGNSALGIVTGFGVDYDGLRVEQSFFARQRTGVFVNPGSGTNTITFDNNEFGSRTAINHDLGFANLNSTISNNLLQLVTVGTNTSGPVTGVNVAVIPNGGTVTVTGNSIASNFIGVDLKDVASGGTAVFEGNTFRDHSNPAGGVRVNGALGATVSFADNTFANGVVFVANVGPLSLDLTSGNQADLGSGPIDIATASLADAFAIADKVFDAVDAPGIGHVRLQTGKVFVTPNSFVPAAPYNTTTPSIQRGVNAATAGDTVHVAAGTFTELVQVNKTVQLLGTQAGVDARTRTGQPETIVNGPSGAFALVANDIVLDGFTVEGTTAPNPQGVGIFAANGFSGHAIRNNIVQDNIFGLYLNSNGVNETVVERNRFADNNNPGAAGGNAIYSDAGLSNALIRNNRFTGDNFNAGIVLAGTQSDITISGNAFEDGNQVVLFNTDNSSVAGNQFSGSLPTPRNTGTAMFIGGGNDNLSVTGNSFTHRGDAAISASDQFAIGANTNLTISGNTITQDAGLLDGPKSMISLTSVGGNSSISGNTIALNGALNATVTSVHGVNVAGSGTGLINIALNELTGGALGGGGAGVRVRGTLNAGAVVEIENNKLNGFSSGVLGEVLAAGVNVDVHGNDLSGNGLAVSNGAGALIDASGNWLGANSVAGAAAAVTSNVDYSPWLETGTDTDGGAPGFQGDFSALNIDDNSPQSAGFAGYVDEALSLLDEDGTLFMHAGTYAENVNTLSQGVRLELGKGTAGVVVNGSLTLNDDDTLAVDLGNLASDQLDVTGAVALGNATLATNALQTLSPNNNIVVLKRGSGTDFFGNVAQGQQLTVGSQSVTARYDIGDGNDFGFITFSNPIISNTGGTVDFTENGVLVAVMPAANLFDADTAVFNGGELRVETIAGSDNFDAFAPISVGSGPGQIEVVGNEVRYEGVTFGTVSGGIGGEALVVAFTSDGNATLEAVQALIRSIGFRVAGDDPTPGLRDVLFVVQDGSGGTGAAVKQVNVIAVNDRPSVFINSDIPTFTENGVNVSIGSGAQVTDFDSDNYDGGNLTVTNTTPDAKDRLSIVDTAEITISGSTVEYLGTPIGTFTGGSGATPLIVSLNANATPEAVRGLILALRFRTVGDAPTEGTRSITIQLEESDGTISLPRTRDVNVVAVNDAPIVTGGGSFNTTVGAPLIAIAPGTTVVDEDSPNLGGGSLHVSIAGGTTGDRLALLLGSGWTITGNEIRQGTTLIGTLNANAGLNGNDLIVTFTADDTAAHAQHIIRGLRFRTTSGTGTRTITIALDDDANAGNGVGTITSTVNVM